MSVLLIALLTTVAVEVRRSDHDGLADSADGAKSGASIGARLSA
jgi:hypothetical protein